MIAEDYSRFTDNLTILSEALRGELSPKKIQLYFTALRDLPIEDVERAMVVCAATSKFFPVPAELREAIRATGDDAAAAAWAQIDKAIAQGPGPSLYLRDGAAGYALETVFGSWPAACEQLHAVFGPAPMSYDDRQAARLERRNPDEGALRQIGGLTPEMVASKRKEFISAYRVAAKTNQRRHYFIGRDHIGVNENAGGWRDRYLTANTSLEIGLVCIADDVVKIRLAVNLEGGQIESTTKAALESGKFEIPEPPVRKRIAAPEQKALPPAPINEEENRASRAAFREALSSFIKPIERRGLDPIPALSDVELQERRQILIEQATNIVDFEKRQKQLETPPEPRGDFPE